ncbi:hypothetical protein [Tessaracoccus rhinocerotis]|nr:hypothetical protein [Tessaracoccus rhinocerotis]
MTITSPYDGDDFYCDMAQPNIPELAVVHLDERVLARAQLR